jgi:hypothetical protein
MTAQQELLQLKERLQRQIAVLQAEMASVDKTIQLLEREGRPTAMSAAIQDKRYAKLGLSDAIRAILTDEFTLPSEIRNVMLSGGYSAPDKASLLSSVFATLKRMDGKDAEGEKIDGKMHYRKRQSGAEVTPIAV